MQLSVREASELLNLSESSIYRLIRKKAIPAYQVNKSHLVNRTELLEWAITNNINVSPKVLHALSQPLLHLPTIVEALRIGGIHYTIQGKEKKEILREIVNRIPTSVSPDMNPDTIFSALVARETLGSTGIGNGIAIPHVRNPIVLDVEQPLIVLCFLSSPIDFGAIDGKPVDTFFMLISTTVRVHLHLLAKLSYLLQSPDVQKQLRNRGDSSALLAAMEKMEKTLAGSGSERPGKN
jgi:PTS system nitrogen regulatory IIA component